MPYLLTKKEIKSRINAKKYLVTQAELINRLDRTQNIFNKIMSDIKKVEDKILKNSSNILWQLGHIQFFYLNLIFSNLLDEFWEKSILEKLNATNMVQAVCLADLFCEYPPQMRDVKYV